MIVSDVHLLGYRRRSKLERQWVDWQVTYAYMEALRSDNQGDRYTCPLESMCGCTHPMLFLFWAINLMKAVRRRLQRRGRYVFSC